MRRGAAVGLVLLAALGAAACGGGARPLLGSSTCTELLDASAAAQRGYVAAQTPRVGGAARPDPSAVTASAAILTAGCRGAVHAGQGEKVHLRDLTQ